MQCIVTAFILHHAYYHRHHQLNVLCQKCYVAINNSLRFTSIHFGDFTQVPSASTNGAITPAQRLIKAEVKQGSDDDDDDNDDNKGDDDNDSEDDEDKERVKSESYDILNVVIMCLLLINYGCYEVF